MRMRLEDFITWLKQTLCKHRQLPEFNVVRNEHDGMESVSAFYECIRCEKVLHVEYSWKLPEGTKVTLPENLTKPSRRL